MARVALLLALGARTVSSKCLSSDSLEAEFLGITGLEYMPSEGSCCQFDVCGLPCAAPHDPKNPPKFYGRSVAMAIAAFCAIGLIASYYVGDDTTKFFVAGRTLPLPIVVMTLASQCIDANAVLGECGLVVLVPFLRRGRVTDRSWVVFDTQRVVLGQADQRDEALDVPDLYARKYGRLTEVLGSLICTASFIALLAGNLVGCGKILAYLYPTVPLKAGIVVSGLVMLLYTAAGGLVSVAYSDCAQAMFGLLGVAVCALWAAHHGKQGAAGQSARWKSNLLHVPGHVRSTGVRQVRRRAVRERRRQVLLQHGEVVPLRRQLQGGQRRVLVEGRRRPHLRLRQ